MSSEVQYEARIKQLKEHITQLEECNQSLEKLKDAWLSGYKVALHRYAWWKDGTQYVGTSGGTLKEALTDLIEETKGDS